MITIRLMLDYDEGPIWPNHSNPITFEKSTGVIIIDNDGTIKELSQKISDMYCNYYEFESHNKPCWFNKDKFIKEKDMLLSLLGQLKDRLNELNDGSYVIEDMITNMYDE